MTTIPRLGIGKKLLISLLLTAAVWIVFAWPVPRFLSHGIPCSAVNTENFNNRSMVSGDHLQLLYNYWLFGDMLAGKTPWFSNIYEFNTGDDNARYNPGSYNMPFSLVYAAGEAIGGRAFGWNLTQFIVLWLTFWLSWLLAARIAANELIAALAALAGLTVPYRWVTLLGGSPTGFAIIWIPLLFLGIDKMMRDSSISGGLMAGIAVNLANWNDKHVFLFGCGMIPVWILFSLVLPAREAIKPWRRLTAVAVFLLLSGLAVLAGLSTGEKLAGTTMGSGRAMDVVRLFSAHAGDFLLWRGEDRATHVFIGYILTALLAVGGGFALCRAFVWPDSHWKTFVASAILFTALGGVLILSLGPNGPFDGLFYVLCRKFISPFRMIRQPDKIFCVMPALIPAILALTLPGLFGILRRRTASIAAACLIAICLVAENAPQIRPQVCLLQDSQDAYKAVADDAAASGYKPFAAVFPLWPGDSHWASLYEHYSSLYRIRMINGYRPAINTNYVENVFRTFTSGNLGELNNDQLDRLLIMGVNHILFHEDAYPEKVGPFASNFALKRLLNHPRLDLLKDSRGIWAFRILETPATQNRPEAGATWRTFFPARRWEAEDTSRCKTSGAAATADSACTGGGYMAMTGTEARICFPSNTLVYTEGLGWLVRLRGKGTLRASCQAGASNRTDMLTVDSAEWKWFRFEPGQYEERQTISLSMELADGGVDIDSAILVAGPWNVEPQPGERVVLPAPCFFHAGSIDLKADSVIFRKDEEPSGPDFYGPGLPLAAGTYKVDVDYSCSNADLTAGSFYVTSGTNRSASVKMAGTGQSASGIFTNTANLPVKFVFVYSRQTDMSIRSVSFTRLDAR